MKACLDTPDYKKQELFTGFYLNASDYKKQASDGEFSNANFRLNYYYTKNNIPFFEASDLLIETLYPTNTFYFLKHIAQLILGVAVFIKTLFTDIRALPDVLVGIVYLVCTLALDTINFFASGISCLLKTAKTINQGYCSINKNTAVDDYTDIHSISSEENDDSDNSSEYSDYQSSGLY